MKHLHAAGRPSVDAAAGPAEEPALSADRDSAAARDSRADVRSFGGDAVSAPALLATLAWQSVPSRPSGA